MVNNWEGTRSCDSSPNIFFSTVFPVLNTLYSGCKLLCAWHLPRVCHWALHDLSSQWMQAKDAFHSYKHFALPFQFETSFNFLLQHSNGGELSLPFPFSGPVVYCSPPLANPCPTLSSMLHAAHPQWTTVSTPFPPTVSSVPPILRSVFFPQAQFEGVWVNVV